MEKKQLTVKAVKEMLEKEKRHWGENNKNITYKEGALSAAMVMGRLDQLNYLIQLLDTFHDAELRCQCRREERTGETEMLVMCCNICGVPEPNSIGRMGTPNADVKLPSEEGIINILNNCQSDVAKKHNLGSQLVTGHKKTYFDEAAVLLINKIINK